MANAPNVLDYINTAVAVATFLISERLPATVETIRAYFSRKLEEPPQDFRPEDALRLVALLVINQDLLRDLTDRAKDAIVDYRQRLPQERQAASGECRMYYALC